MTTPTILLVDDEPAILRALSVALDAQGYRTQSVLSGEKAVARVAEDTPDLVVLDMGLPGIDGIEVIRRLRAFAPTVPIIVLSAHGDDRSKVAALDLGANDYVSKPFSMPELSARVRAALRQALRGAHLEAAVIHRGDLSIDLMRREVTVAGHAVALTPKQFDLLVCFARHAGRVLTHRMLAAEVWNDPAGADIETVRVHVSQLRRRIEDGPRPTRILTEPGVGYRFAPRSDDTH